MQLSTVSRLKNDNFVQLLGYCLEANNRILVFEYATMGSLHDVLHGICTWIYFSSFSLNPYVVGSSRLYDFCFRIQEL